MSIRNILGVLGRHILAIAVLLVASAAAVTTVLILAPSAYQSESTMVILGPNVEYDFQNVPLPVNPWQNLADPSVEVAASAISSVADSDEFKDRIDGLGVTSDTTVRVATETSGDAIGEGAVFLSLTALNEDPQAAQDDLAILSNELSDVLQQRQLDVGAPPETLLRLVNLNPPTEAQVLASARMQLTAVTALVSLTLSGLALVLLEFAARRRQRLRTKDGAAPEPAVAVDNVVKTGNGSASGAVAASGVSNGSAVTDGPPSTRRSEGAASGRQRPRPRRSPAPLVKSQL